MHTFRWSALAFAVAVLVLFCFLLASFLPFFLQDVWAPLWDVQCQPAGSPSRSFSVAGPTVGLLPWPALLAVPISSALVLVWFLLVAWLVVPRR